MLAADRARKFELAHRCCPHNSIAERPDNPKARGRYWWRLLKSTGRVASGKRDLARSEQFHSQQREVVRKTNRVGVFQEQALQGAEVRSSLARLLDQVDEPDLAQLFPFCICDFNGTSVKASTRSPRAR